MIELARIVPAGHVKALFVGRTPEFAAQDFPAQYDLLLNKYSTIKSLSYTEQVHADRAFEVSLPAKRLHFAGEGDALHTREEGVALLIRTADCIPILFYSETESLIGAVHAGWRGLEKRILSKTLRSIEANVRSLKLILGPFIGSNSYEVGSDVADRFEASMNIARPGGKFMLNLKKILQSEIESLGISQAQVTWHDADTLRDENWYSARRGDTARNLSLIWMAKDDQ